MSHRRAFRATLLLPFVVAGCNSTADNGGPSDGGDSGKCAQDPTLTCSGSATGFLCTGSVTPDVSVDINLNCTTGTTQDAGGTQYCCTFGSAGPDAAAMPTLEAGTCALAPPLTPPSFNCTATGFLCNGATPSTAMPSVSCNVGTPWMGETFFCCAPVSPGGTPEGGQ